MPFSANLQYNKFLPADNYGNIQSMTTVKSIWDDLWTQYLRDDVMYLKEQKYKNTDGYPHQRAFWYAPDPTLWDAIFAHAYGMTDEDRQFVEEYKTYQETLLNYWIGMGHIKMEGKFLMQKMPSRNQTISSRPRVVVPQDISEKIPIPRKTALKIKQNTVVDNLKARLSTLEKKLHQVQKKENTQHLLQQVLEQLDT
jgi:hypothetical protein